ncbi:sodium/potassium/calcium exchanger 5-like [Branchiostoma floridae x Branchiostoma belcheri]
MPASVRRNGGVLLHVLVVVYMFSAIAIVCDDYFVPSLETTSTRLGLSHNVAGATFMAVGSSAPELFVAMLGVFVTKNDVGVETVVGSAIFNVLVITGLTALCSSTLLSLSWWPLFRDSFFYLISVVTLVLIIYDEKVYSYEAMVLLGIYCLYIFVMYLDPRISKWATDKVKGWHMSRESSALLAIKHSANTNPDSYQTLENEGETPAEPDGNVCGNKDSVNVEKKDPEKAPPAEPEKPPVPPPEAPRAAGEGPPKRSLLTVPEGKRKIAFFLNFPIHAVLYVTIPDCHSEGTKHRYLLTFFMTTLWIAVFSYVLVWMSTIIGFTIGIPDEIMGLTVLAIGTSIPDALSSVLVSSSGLGDMAVSNSLGSNIFDILVCLGLPWLFKSAGGFAVHIYGESIIYSTITLISTVFFLVVDVHLNGWKLTKSLGVTCLCAYVFVLTLAIVYELNIFTAHLPICPLDADI